MEYQEIIDSLTRDGYTTVATMAGPMPISDWLPYGNVPGGVNYNPKYSAWQGEIIGDGKVRDLPKYPHISDTLALGVWTFSK